MLSPLMSGPQCMTFYYHMFGESMSCVAVYIKNETSNVKKVLWLKSGNRGRKWIKGQVDIRETGIYQVKY